MKKIVIIGGGFAGINLAEGLASKQGFEVTLVDRNNYNFFPPLLYQVATGFLEPSNICYPFRKLFRKHKNIHFFMGEFLELVPAENKIILSTSELVYDCLVFATGAETNFFGMENVKKNALPMKNVNDALDLRNHFLENMEQATRTTDTIERTKLLTIVIAGGGPTGVEVAGMLADMKRDISPKDYPEVSGKGYESHIYIVDGGTTVLGPMSQQSQHYAQDALIKMGVEMKMDRHVNNFENDTVTLDNGETITAKTLVWAAGVQAPVFKGVPATSYGRGKRIMVDAYNKVSGLENVYAIGDVCLQITDEKFIGGHPQLAQVAIQQGTLLARNFIKAAAGKPLQVFKYWDKGTMAIIGRNKAVTDLPKPNLHFKGFIAWLMWVFIHLISLVNYRNRFRTLYNWFGAYITKDQSFRLIIRPKKQ